MIPVRLPAVAPPPVGRSRVGGGRLDEMDRRLRAIAADWGTDLRASPILLLAVAALIAASFGLRLGGLPMAVVGGVAVGLSPLVLGRMGRGRAARLRVGGLASRCLDMSRAVRSGLPLAAVLAEFADDGGAERGLRTAGRQIANGRPVRDALAEWADSAAEPAVVLLAAALLMSEQQGGDMARCLEAAADSIRSEVAAAQRRRTVVAQAQMSARVLAALPVVFALLLSTARGGPTFDSAGELVGLAVGLGLMGLGLAWMNALIGGIR